LSLGDLGPAAEALAAAGYLAKPVEAGRLIAEVRRCAGAPAAAVLVVDDESMVRDLLGVALRHFGFTVRPAAGGAEAVDLYRRHGADIDVVLLDVRMPGLDGPQTLAELRRLNPQVRCCFMSGDTGAYTTADLLTLGAARVFAKPFGSLGDLARGLREAAAPACRLGPSAAAVVPKTLRLFEGDEPLAQVKEGALLTVGRHGDNGLALPDAGVSRLHARIRFDGRRWTVADCGSTNGTRIDGEPVRGEAALHDGDVLALGRVALRVRIDP
jgi:CheY-like chemotaxis protein